MRAFGSCGFQFEETMAGTYARVDSPHDRRSLRFSIRIYTGSLFRYLGHGCAAMIGTLHAAGLADSVPIEGKFRLGLFPRGEIAYSFNFTGDDGEPYHFGGVKHFRANSPVRTLTELYAEIQDGAGNLVATSETRFDLRSEWLRFLLSWRLV